MLLSPGKNSAAQTFSGLVRDTYVFTDEEGSDSMVLLDQNYVVGFEFKPTDLLQYRLNLRASDRRSELSEGVSETFRLEPGLEVLFGNPVLRFSTALRSQIEENSDQPDATRTLFQSQLAWRPADLPEVTFRYDIQRNKEEKDPTDPTASIIDSDFGRLLARTLYEVDSWRFLYSFARNESENRILDITQANLNNLARVDFAETFMDNRLSISASANVEKIDTKETAQREVVVPIVRPPARGLYVVDTTPEEGHLNTVAGLTDGNLGAATSPLIEIGGANTDRNIGIDFGRPVDVDRLYIHTTGDSSSGIIWSVFISEDNLNWELVTTSASSIFDRRRLRYDISFPNRLTRYVKAVNSGFNGFPNVLVTEIVGLGDEFRSGEETASFFTPSVAFTASARPLDWLRFGYDFYRLHRDERPTAPVDAPAEENQEDTGQHGFFVGAETGRYLSVRVRRQDSFFDSSLDRVPDTESELTSIAFASEPLPSLTTILTLTRTDDRQDDEDRSRQDSAIFLVSAQVYPDLRISADIERSSRDDFQSGQNLKTLRIGGSIDAVLRPELQAVLDWDFTYRTLDRDFLPPQPSYFGGPPPAAARPAEVRDDRSHAIRLDLTYRPGRAFFLTSQLRWDRMPEEGGAFSMWYTANWVPSKKLQMNLSYREGGGVGGEAAIGQVRWTLSRHMDLEGTLSRSEAQDIAGGSQATVSSILTLHLRW